MVPSTEKNLWLKPNDELNPVGRRGFSIGFTFFPELTL
jgi:hypothetical protein